jgi:hypothetical protein
MLKFLQSCKFVCYLLIGVLIAEAAPFAAHAQDALPRIENIRVQINGRSSVYIDYDLIGPTDQVYKVSISMRKASDSTFTYDPQTVAGDIGPDVFSGRNNRIVWSISKEFPEGIKEGEYFFVFSVESASTSSGGISLPVIVAGGAAVVGGILALVLLSKKSDTPPSGSGFPKPPARP